jgi:cyclopropane-fatty-acyl-phospholipid synthase
MSTSETVAARDGDYGGSASAVQYHYDVGREFYRLWLDETLTYSCALWDDANPDESLHAAQLRKIDHHLAQARAERASAVLDVGCGWGGLIRRLTERTHPEHVVGLTLSEDQAAYVRGMSIPNVDVRLESWTRHEPLRPYDSIVSVGALEHFTKPKDSVPEKIATYREFFEKCRSWLSPTGRMSLQTISYGSMNREEASAFINNEIFPASDLPRLAELAAAADGIFEVSLVRDDRLHYARTFQAWAANLRSHRAEAIALVGDEVTKRYERYLKQSSIGFYMGKIGLLRLSLRPIVAGWSAMSAP